MNCKLWRFLRFLRWLRGGYCRSAATTHGPVDRWRDVTVSQEAAERLENDLEPGLRAIGSVVARLDRERMRRAVDVLIAGLAHDLIDADDFAR